MKTLATLIAIGAATIPADAAEKALDALIGRQAAVGVPALVGRSLETFLEVETAYREARYAAALEALDALWRDAPPGSDPWVEALRATRKLAASEGLNIGSPSCYYALRMLSDCVRWRLESGSRVTADAAPTRAVLTVVLAGLSRGVEPRDWSDLEKQGGIPVEHTLEPALLADNFRIVRQSLWLFGEYMLASTGGLLGVQTQVLHLPETAVSVQCSMTPHRTAGMSESAAEVIARAVPQETLVGTDWWWFVYPSHVPEQHPDFERTEFITGGMGKGPDGASPCFIIDDRWLTRKPPHIGHGPYTDVERRAYLPQWVQHEYMHHLFSMYPAFGLEKASHQWFDRQTWPDDFEGRFEPDYYAEAMHKRLCTGQTEPPLHVALRYQPPAPALVAQIEVEALVGSYRHEPVQNDWHVGEIAVETRGPDGHPAVLRWTNQAGASWRLFPDPSALGLRTGEENPYYAENPAGGRVFRTILRRDEQGDYLPEAAGFRFQGGFYALQPALPGPPRYSRRRLEGWTVFVNQRLLNDEVDLGRRALRLLETKLYEIGRVVPDGACRELRQVRIWLGVDDGHAPCAEYHPSEEWLRDNGYNPDKAGCVEIGCAAKFLEWSKQQPMMVLHELAHAYHHRIVGHDHATLQQAYAAAVAGGTYDAVLCHDGRTARAYAMSNSKEYFAELTECFFGTNDFYPFVRAELEKHDPEGYRLIQELWSNPIDTSDP